MGAAAAIVPAITGGAATEATQVLGAVASEDATRVLPSMAGSAATTTAPQPVPAQRSPWTWPLIALSSVLLLALVGVLIAVFAEPNEPTPVPTDTSSVEPTEIETPSPTPTVDTVLIVEEEWVGLTRAQVQEKAAGLDLRIEEVDGNIAPSQDQQGRSYRTTPIRGEVQTGTLLTVYFYTNIPTPPQPSNLAIAPGEGPYPAGSDVTLNWPRYDNCPAGYSLEGYNVTIVGGTPAQGNPLPASATSLIVTLADSGQLRVTYVAQCGSLQSERSNELAVPIAEE